MLILRPPAYLAWSFRESVELCVFSRSALEICISNSSRWILLVSSFTSFRVSSRCITEYTILRRKTTILRTRQGEKIFKTISDNVQSVSRRINATGFFSRQRESFYSTLAWDHFEGFDSHFIRILISEALSSNGSRGYVPLRPSLTTSRPEERKTDLTKLSHSNWLWFVFCTPDLTFRSELYPAFQKNMHFFWTPEYC